MPSECVFKFNKPNEVYFSGEPITGSINLKTENDKDVKEIVVKLYGRTKVKWKTGENRNVELSLIDYSAAQTYVNKTIVVHNEEGILKSGTYNYGFKFKTNEDWPSSCETEFGHTRYEIVFIINKYGGYDNVFVKPITFIRTFNLNTETYHKRPLMVESNYGKTSCLCGLVTSSIYFTLKTPFFAFAAGQEIHFILRTFNINESSIHNLYVNFVRRITYEVTDPTNETKTIDYIIAHKGDLQTRFVTNLVEDIMVLPGLPPTTLEPCAISIQYFLTAHMEHLCCLTSTLEAEKEIVIGTVPIRHSLSSDHLFKDIGRANEVQQLLDRNLEAYNLPHIAFATAPTNYDIDPYQQNYIDKDLAERLRVEHTNLYPMFPPE